MNHVRKIGWASPIDEALRAFLSKTAESLRMPARFACLVIGIPALIELALYLLCQAHVKFNVDWIYYPTFAFVYVIWIFPILVPGERAQRFR
jgi:hypothetical protein